MLLWLWHRPAVAAPIQPLTWELPYALKKGKKKKKPLFQEQVASSIIFSHCCDLGWDGSVD